MRTFSSMLDNRKVIQCQEESCVHKKVTGKHIESIRVIESSCGALHQIHHSNDFLIRGRMFVHGVRQQNGHHRQMSRMMR